MSSYGYYLRIKLTDIFETLKYLMSAPAVTGFEEQRRHRIIEIFKKYCDTVEVDVMGNVIGILGHGNRNVMLAGHYDQLGFMINHVDEKGFAGFSKVGGWDKRVAFGTRLKIWVGDNPEDYLVGTVAVKAAHLTDQKERDKSPEIAEMRIDFGAKNNEEAKSLGVKPGVVCTPYLDVTYLGKHGSDLIIGPAFDDISGVVGLIEAMEILSAKPPASLKLHFVATVQEEIGLRGATISAYNIKPWAAIATDVTHALAPGLTKYQVSGIEIGKGPVVAIGANFTRVLWEIIEKEANANEIPYQRQAVPARSGTDAWAIQVERGGTITGLIKLPNRYMHSPNEVISISDLRNQGKLIAVTIRALEKCDLKHSVEVYHK